MSYRTRLPEDEVVALRRWQAEALELLNDLAEHFDGEADAEYFTDHAGPVGNKAMGFLVQCNQLIANARND